MGKSKGITLGELSDATGRGPARSHNDVAVQPGHGHSRLGIEREIAQRGSQRESQITHPFPTHSGERADSTVPTPHTKHVASNTVKREHFPDGINPYGFTDKASAKPATQTMERALTGKAPMKDAPVPRAAPRVHPDLMSKAEEVAHEDPSQGLGVTLSDDGTLGHA